MKNKKMKVFIIAIVIIAILGGLGFIAQKKYYEKEAIKNTRFITFVKNRIVLGTKFENFINESLYNTKWSQSKLSGDNYLVSITGDNSDKNDSTVRILYYIRDNGKDNAPTCYNKDTIPQVFNNNKEVDRVYAFNVLALKYYAREDTSTTIASLKDFTKTINFIKAIDSDFDDENIDKNEVKKLLSDKKRIRKDMGIFINNLSNNKYSSDELANMGIDGWNQEESDAFQNLDEVQYNELLDEFTKSLYTSEDEYKENN